MVSYFILYDVENLCRISQLQHTTPSSYNDSFWKEVQKLEKGSESNCNVIKSNYNYFSHVATLFHDSRNYDDDDEVVLKTRLRMFYWILISFQISTCITHATDAHLMQVQFFYRKIVNFHSGLSKDSMFARKNHQFFWIASSLLLFLPSLV